MSRLAAVLLFGFFFYVVYVQALECGIVEEMGREDVKAVIGKCVPSKGDESKEKSDKSSSESVESSEEASKTYSLRRGIGTQVRQKREMNSSDEKEKQANNTTGHEKCIVQCILSELGMTDPNGYPDHHGLAQGLLKNAKGRELRDFIQDSTDECFQLMDQGERMDSCGYSSHLVKCLAEKGRSNCADWQYTNLPFHT